MEFLRVHAPGLTRKWGTGAGFLCIWKIRGKMQKIQRQTGQWEVKNLYMPQG